MIKLILEKIFRKGKPFNSHRFWRNYTDMSRRFEREARKWDEPLKAVAITPRIHLICKNPAIAAAIGSRLI